MRLGPWECGRVSVGSALTNLMCWSLLDGEETWRRSRRAGAGEAAGAMSARRAVCRASFPTPGVTVALREPGPGWSRGVGGGGGGV
jgi:hypothetical protein